MLRVSFLSLFARRQRLSSRKSEQYFRRILNFVSNRCFIFLLSIHILRLMILQQIFSVVRVGSNYKLHFIKGQTYFKNLKVHFRLDYRLVYLENKFDVQSPVSSKDVIHNCLYKILPRS